MTDKTEVELTDEELELFEFSTTPVRDVLDELLSLQKELEESQMDRLNFFKYNSKLGRLCPYYKKARRIFIQDRLKIIKDRLDIIMGGLGELNE